LTYSERITQKSAHPSAAGQAQDRESLRDRDQRSTAERRSQLGDNKQKNDYPEAEMKGDGRV